MRHNAKTAITPFFMTATDARKVLGISLTSVYELIREGKIDSVVLLKRRLLKTDSVRRLAGLPSADPNKLHAEIMEDIIHICDAVERLRDGVHELELRVANLESQAASRKDTQ